MKVSHLISNLLKAALVFGLGVTLTACSSNPHKAEKISTEIDSKGQVSGDTTVGIKDGDMIVQRKVQMNEELRSLQYEVFELEDRVYGNRKYGSMGLYGSLRNCKSELSDPKNGGDGKMKWTEPIDRVTDKEEELKIGLDESKNLVGVSEEFLKDRIQRFREYRRVLQKRQDEYEEKVSLCKNDLRAQRASLPAPVTN